MKPALLSLFLMFLAPFAAALEPRTEHTFRLAEGESPPSVSLQDLAWLAGDWRGEAFGATFEEVWNSPSAGSMVGFFKLIKGDEVDFYELLTIMEAEGRISLRVKHFTKDFVAWEEKEDYVDFKLIGIEPNAIHFGGLSFYRLGEDAMEAFMVFRRGGEVTEEKLTYKRVR